MTYQKIELTLTNPLSFWEHFSDQERFFWYDSQTEQLVIGAQRLSSLDDKDQDFRDYPFVFHSQSFFESLKGDLWKDFGGETLAFKHYYCVGKAGSTYLTCKEAEHILDIDIPIIKHSFKKEEEDIASWATLFHAIQAQLQEGKCDKIVASRQVPYYCEQGFNSASIIQNLIKNNPQCLIFAYQKGDRLFLGASPEILVQKKGDNILSYALAGTISKSLENASQTLLADKKNRQEQAIVVKKIQEKLLEKSTDISISDTGLMSLKNVYHLRTVLTAKDSKLTLRDWAKHLHPTPALGGEPSAIALPFLRQEETHERGLYAAPLGLIDSHGDGTIIVGIRSALIVGKQLYAYAGCGIVPASDLQEEFQETQVKLQTILEAL